MNAIDSEEDYLAALQRLEVIFDARNGTPEGDELEILGRFIDDYEEKYFPVE